MTRIRIAAVLLLVFNSPARAQPVMRNSPGEHEIERQLASVAPGVVPMFQAATRALDNGKPADALALFQEVLKAAPGFTPALRRSGYCLARMGKPDEGIAVLEHALQIERTPDNLVGLASVLASPTGSGPGPAPYMKRALALASEAVALDKNPSEPDNLLFATQMAVQLEDTEALRRFTPLLLAHFPKHPFSHFFEALRAAADHDWIRADAEINTAEQLGAPHEIAQQLRDSGIHTRAVLWRSVYVAFGALVVWAAGLAILSGAGRRLSNATLQSITEADPNAAPSSSELALRHRYRTLVRMAGIYYYVSLPFVVLLVLATNAAIIMGFLWLDWVPIKLVLILVVGVIVTLYKMVQSLFVRVEAQDPGRVLEASEAPGLWKVVHEVADAVQTRAADEIRVTEGTDMAVYERGTAQQRTRDEATRVLLVGLGLLEGFRQSAFRAVLAHEYGHFSNRDTAGGEIALRVQQDMFKFAMAMIAHGQNVWWNVAFHFLRLYGGLFRRISHGATRLQEVLADRVAAQKYGPGPFEEGLRHAIRRGIEFDAFVNREARRAIALRHSFSDPYLASTPGDDEVQRAVADAMSRETTEDDSHPSPLTRFALVSAVRTEHTPGDTGMVWDLFADPASLRAEMTSRLASRVREVQATV